jgi:hypothetical protein
LGRLSSCRLSGGGDKGDGDGDGDALSASAAVEARVPAVATPATRPKTEERNQGVQAVEDSVM